MDSHQRNDLIQKYSETASTNELLIRNYTRANYLLVVEQYNNPENSTQTASIYLLEVEGKREDISAGYKVICDGASNSLKLVSVSLSGDYVNGEYITLVMNFEAETYRIVGLSLLSAI